MKLEEQIKKFEKEYEEYLEADMNKEASKIKVKLNKAREKLELEEAKKELRELKKLKYEVNKCHHFLKIKGLEAEYNRYSYCESED